MTTTEEAAPQSTAKQLHEARQDLAALQRDLPSLQEKVSALHREVKIAREAKDFDQAASLEQQRIAYQELLQSHHSEIASAKGEVARLEQQHTHEQRIARMTQHAERAEAHWQTLEKAVEEAAATLRRTALTVLKEWEAHDEERRGFIDVATQELGKSEWYGSPVGMGLKGAEQAAFKQRVHDLLDELYREGAELSTLLTDNVVDLSYRSTAPLPSSPMALLVWGAVKTRRDVPKRLEAAIPTKTIDSTHRPPRRGRG